jgi:gliding motility-associated lipoprotein GldH
MTPLPPRTQGFLRQAVGRPLGWLGMLGILLTVGLVSGCRPDAIFAGSEAIPETGWEADAPVAFEWTVQDTTLRQDFFLDIRHDQSYPFSNIYFFLDVNFPNGKRLRDTVACDLADEQGQWLGTGFGNMVDQRVRFRSGTAFPIPGNYRMEVRHAMRLNPLPGVHDVGFRLERARLNPGE